MFELVKFMVCVSLCSTFYISGLTEAMAQDEPEQPKVDILFLFDDTVSFIPYIEHVTDVITDVIAVLESERPNHDFGFGVARFEDFGGPGWTFCGGPRPCEEDRDKRINGRPFILNQPVVTIADAGSKDARNALIIDALQRQAPGFGGDDPESAVSDALFQAATGLGFDGNGDGSKLGLAGNQPAGSLTIQTTPDESGDVPPFSTLVSGVPVSGTVGGAGFRSDSLKLIFLATDICSVTAFPAGTTIPEKVEGRYSIEAVADFACRNTTPGVDRFGFVANGVSDDLNTVANAVVPVGAASLQETVGVLNQLDIRVMGMGPEVAPAPSGSGPSFEPASFLSALARLTGAVDSSGVPLVLDLEASTEEVSNTILQAITIAVDSPENPGCAVQNIGPGISGLTDISKTQKKSALRSTKILRRSNVQFSKTKNWMKKIRKTEGEVQKALQQFPPSVTICANLACESMDRSEQLGVINSASNYFVKRTKRNSKLYRSQFGKSRTFKRLVRLAKRTRQSDTEAGGLIAQLPAQISNCAG